MMFNSDSTKEIIRSKLKGFLIRRKHAYEKAHKSGARIPDYGLKMHTIEALSIQLRSSASWDLQANLRWIHVMHDDIMLLLPYEFHDDPKQLTYRKHITDLLRFCEDLLDTKTMFNQNLKSHA